MTGAFRSAVSEAGFATDRMILVTSCSVQAPAVMAWRTMYTFSDNDARPHLLSSPSLNSSSNIHPHYLYCLPVAVRPVGSEMAASGSLCQELIDQCLDLKALPMNTIANIY